MSEPEKQQVYPAVWRLICSAVTGLLLASSFPPMESWEAVWIAIIPMLVVVSLSSPGRSFKWGFLSGLFRWLPSVAWLLRLCDNGGPPVLVVIGWLALSAYCALYEGGFYACVSWLLKTIQRPRDDDSAALSKLKCYLRRPVLALLVPLCWVGFEYLRSTLFTGFSWNALGISQYRNLAIIQVAEWGGVYAVSFVILLMNTVLAFTVLDVFPGKGSRRRRVRLELLLGLSICAICWVAGARRANRMALPLPGDRDAKIAAVQPNIPQLEKWTQEAVLDIYRSLAYQTELAASSQPDLIVWPETALPGAFPYDVEAITFAANMASLGAPILVGAMETSESSSGEYQFYNSSFLVATNGTFSQKYRKIHLVPFGEYIPFDRSVPLLSRCAPLGFSCTPGTDSAVFRLNGISFSTLICFEDTIPSLTRKAVLGGARFLITQTNDAWFDGSSGAVQHLSHCVFRCVESRVEAVRAANTGVTCHIDRRGRIRALDEEGSGSTFAGFAVYGVTVSADDMEPTLYTRFGDSVFALPCALFAVAICLLVLRETRAAKRKQNLRPDAESGEEDA